MVKLSLSYRFDLASRALLQTTGFNKQDRRHGPVILHSALRHRGLWGSLLLLAVFSGIAAPVAYARARHSDAWAREHYAAAERIREALNGRPAAGRTRRDYQRVLNAYRNIYMGAPSCSKADPSVVAVAETLVEMGRRFDDDKILLGKGLQNMLSEFGIVSDAMARKRFTHCHATDVFLNRTCCHCLPP